MLRTYVPALVAALVLAASFPPVGGGYWVFVAPVVFIWGLIGAGSGRRAATAGFAFGAAYIALLMSWISNLGIEAIVALTLSQAPFFAALGWLIYRARRRIGWEFVAIVAGGWALMDLMRERVPFGGLSWGALGYAVAPYPAPRTAAAWIGTSGWTVVLAGFAAAAVLLLIGRGFRWLAVFTGALVVLAGLGAGIDESPIGPTLTVAIIQGNSPCPLTHCLDEDRLIFESHLELTRRLQPGDVDLVVWAESSTGGGYDPVLSPEAAQLIGAEAQRIGSFILVGGDRPEGDDQFVNANVLFGPQGRIIREYQKIHPVPFGEYVPLRSLLEGIPVLARVPRDMVRGTGPVVFSVKDGTFGSVISFEGSFARYSRSHVKAGAQLMVVATNESSFGDSPAADQLIGMTTMRAAETGLDVVHAAITGASTLIADGEPGDRTALFEKAILVGDVTFRQQDQTLYVRWGDWLPILAIVWMAAAILWGDLRERPRLSPELASPSDV